VFDFIEDFWRLGLEEAKRLRCDEQRENTKNTRQKEHSKNNDLEKNLLSA
jgi:hypothetical protein